MFLAFLNDIILRHFVELQKLFVKISITNNFYYENNGTVVLFFTTTVLKNVFFAKKHDIKFQKKNQRKLDNWSGSTAKNI